MASGFIRARSSALTICRVAGTSRMCSVMTSQVSKNSALLRAVAWPSTRPLKRRIARPGHDVHAKRLAVTRDRRADAAIAKDAKRLVAQGSADADLPLAGLERRHLLRQLTRRRQNERPDQFGCGITRDASVLARRYDNATARAGGNIDMRIDAALADEFKARQPFKQISLDFGALANEHQAFGVL